MNKDIERKVVYLEITSFIGTSIGAQHYYGKLVCTEPWKSIELTRILTARQADLLNDSRRREFPGIPLDYIYRKGYKTNGFDTESSIKALAIRTYHQHFPDAEILLLGRAAHCDPKIVLDGGTKEFAALSKRLLKRCEKLGWYDKGNEDEVDELFKEWESSLKKVLG